MPTEFPGTGRQFWRFYRLAGDRPPTIVLSSFWEGTDPLCEEPSYLPQWRYGETLDENFFERYEFELLDILFGSCVIRLRMPELQVEVFSRARMLSVTPLFMACLDTPDLWRVEIGPELLDNSLAAIALTRDGERIIRMAGFLEDGTVGILQRPLSKTDIRRILGLE